MAGLFLWVPILFPTCLDSYSRVMRIPKRRKKQRRRQGTWCHRGLKVRNVLHRGQQIEAPLDPGRDGSSGPSNWVRSLLSTGLNSWHHFLLSGKKSLTEAGTSRQLLKVMGCSISWTGMSGLVVVLAENHQILSASGPSKEAHLRVPGSRPCARGRHPRSRRDGLVVQVLCLPAGVPGAGRWSGTQGRNWGMKGKEGSQATPVCSRTLERAQRFFSSSAQF